MASSTAPVATDPAPRTSAEPSVGPDASAMDDPLLLGLLDAADLPGLASPEGPGEGTRYDIDDVAFEASRGIRIVSQTWQSLSDGGLAAVFDFRMQFPSAAAAAAYLRPPSRCSPSRPRRASSQVSRPWWVPTPASMAWRPPASPAVLLRTYLFRVGSVVAKVEGEGTDVDPATIDALARTAAQHPCGRPPAPGSPRPAATPSPTAHHRTAAHGRGARRRCSSSTCRPTSARAASPTRSGCGRASWPRSCAARRARA
ncbi:MAG: hypothetical protein U0667_11535 [Chloroflexota bacterium]